MTTSDTFWPSIFDLIITEKTPQQRTELRSSKNLKLVRADTHKPTLTLQMYSHCYGVRNTIKEVLQLHLFRVCVQPWATHLFQQPSPLLWSTEQQLRWTSVSCFERDKFYSSRSRVLFCLISFFFFLFFFCSSQHHVKVYQQGRQERGAECVWHFADSNTVDTEDVIFTAVIAISGSVHEDELVNVDVCTNPLLSWHKREKQRKYNSRRLLENTHVRVLMNLFFFFCSKDWRFLTHAWLCVHMATHQVHGVWVWCDSSVFFLRCCSAIYRWLWLGLQSSKEPVAICEQWPSVHSHHGSRKWFLWVTICIHVCVQLLHREQQTHKGES